MDMSIPTLSWILGGVGVVAAGAFAYFAVSGRSQETDLANTCSPRCPSDDVTGLRHSYLAADISWGVGVVSLGAAVLLALRSSGMFRSGAHRD
jgi:hypothetical protein